MFQLSKSNKSNESNEQILLGKNHVCYLISDSVVITCVIL